MYDESELAGVQGTAGISRRDMMRKSAIVGGAGALMWAAPSITKFGGAAFGQDNGTPAGGYSNVGAIIDCGADGLFRAKVEFDDKVLNDWEWEVAAGALGGCEALIDAWGGASDLTKAKREEIGLLWVENAGTKTFNGKTYQVFAMTLPTNGACKFLNGTNEAVASSLKEGQCCIVANRVSDYRLEWYGPFPNGNKEPCSDATVGGQTGYDVRDRD